jgi:hypothetical protein
MVKKKECVKCRWIFFALLVLNFFAKTHAAQPTEKIVLAVTRDAFFSRWKPPKLAPRTRFPTPLTMPCRTYWAVAAGSFLLLLAMVWSFLFASRDPKLCEMSYSRPLYVEQLSFNASWSRLAEKYSLFLYREGGIDISDNVYRDSQPVLFIPGHAGSYKQSRSIASETTVQFHQLLQQRGRQHQQAKLDFFTCKLHW